MTTAPGRGDLAGRSEEVPLTWDGKDGWEEIPLEARRHRARGPLVGGKVGGKKASVSGTESKGWDETRSETAGDADSARAGMVRRQWEAPEKCQ